MEIFANDFPLFPGLIDAWVLQFKLIESFGILSNASRMILIPLKGDLYARETETCTNLEESQNDHRRPFLNGTINIVEYVRHGGSSKNRSYRNVRFHTNGDTQHNIQVCMSYANSGKKSWNKVCQCGAHQIILGHPNATIFKVRSI